MKLPAWKHVIWDLDGTLLDTYPATDEALLAALEGLEYIVSPETVNLETVRGLTRETLDHAIQTLAARFGIAESQLYAAYEREYAVLGLRHSPAMPGAAQVMQSVRAAGGLNLLATHRDREGALWRLKAAGLDSLLDDLLSVSDGYPRKPDPALFLALLQSHGLAPATVLAVGDRGLDMLAGRAAGCQTALLVTAGVELETAADRVLSGLAELVVGSHPGRDVQVG